MGASASIAKYHGQPPTNGKSRQCEGSLNKDGPSGKKGDRCPRLPIAGGNVCTAHGGRAPQVKRSATERLADLVHPAISALKRDLDITDDADPALRRLRSSTAQDILDRNNYGGKRELEITAFTVDPKTLTDDELRQVIALKEMLGKRVQSAAPKAQPDESSPDVG